MNKISIKTFLFENGLISELDSSWKSDFLTGARGMPKTTEDVLNYLQDVYSTAFGGEQNVQVINRKMARWIIEQISKLGGTQNIGTTDRDKLITIMTWVKISGSEGNIPKMDLNAAYDLANKKIEEKTKKETTQKAANELPEPPITKVEQEGLVERVYTIPDGSGRVWVKVNPRRAGEFFDKLCDANKAYGVGCQSNNAGYGAQPAHRGADRVTFTLLGPEKGKKLPISTLLSLSIVESTSDMREGKQVGNQAIGTALYGWDDLLEKYVEFLATTAAKNSISKSTDGLTWTSFFDKKKFELLNKLDLLRPDFVENSKKTILNLGKKEATEWIETRSLDAVEALNRFGPKKFIENIDGYTKSATFKEALEQLKVFLPDLAKTDSSLILSKIDFLLDLLPADDFKKIIATVGLKDYIKNNVSDFEKMLKKLVNVNSKDSKIYKEIFNSIIDSYFETIIKSYNLKGAAGVDKFMDFLEMPKSDKHKFVKRNHEGKVIALKKVVEVNPDTQERTEKEVEFPLADSLSVAPQRERREFLKKNEEFIKTLISGSDEKKDIDFSRIYFLETNPQEIQKSLKAEKEKFINYYNNPAHQDPSDVINGIPMPGIFKFYQMLNRGHGGVSEDVGSIKIKKIPTYKFDLEDLRDEKVINEIGSYFRALITGSSKGKLTTDERYEILHSFLLMLHKAGESKEKIIDTIRQYNPANLPIYKNTTTPISFVAYKDYYKLFNIAGFEDSEVLNIIKNDSEELLNKMTYGDFEQLKKSFSTPHYNVKVGEMAEFLGDETTGYDDRDRVIKKRISLAYLFMGRRYKISAVDENAKDKTGRKSAKIKVIDNRGTETNWMNTSDFNVTTKYLGESKRVRNYVSKKLIESYKKMKK